MHELLTHYKKNPKEPDCKDAKLWQADKYGSNQEEVEGGLYIDPHNWQTKAAFSIDSRGHFNPL